MRSTLGKNRRYKKPLRTRNRQSITTKPNNDMSKDIKVAIIGIGTPLMPKTYTESELREKLKEQRDLCAEAVPSRMNIPINVKISVRNAPEPKI